MMDIFQHAETWLVVTFAIFVAIAWKFGKVSAMHQLDSYINTIKQRINEATELRGQAAKLAAEYETRQQNALQEAQSILDEAQKEAALILANGERDMQERLAARQKQFDAEMAHIESSALAELKDKMAALVEQYAREQLAARLNGDTQSALIDSSIATARDAHKAA